jgi:phosphoglycerol transferase MdoB-like AlkP superfamily enzyme
LLKFTTTPSKINGYHYLGMYLLLAHPYLERFIIWRMITRNYFISSNLVLFMYLFLLVLGLMIVAFFLELIISKAVRDLWKNQSSKSVVAILGFFISSFGFIFFNLLQNEFDFGEMARWAGGMPVIYIYNFLLFASVFVIFLMLINRIWIASLVYLTFVGLIGFANWKKVLFRSEPILPSDLGQLATLPDLTRMIGLQWVVYLLLALIAFGLLVYFAQRKLLSGKIYDWKFRIVGTMIAVGVLIFFTNGLQNYTRDLTKENPSLATIVLRAGDLHLNPETVGFNSMKNGWAFNFLSLFGLKPMETPEGYSLAKMQEIAEKFTNLANQINEKRTNDVNDQTVIYILSESFSDPTRIPGLTLSEDPIPFIRSLMKETTSGLMFSAGYGGGTANMEFEALTSLSLNNFSPGLTTPFMQLVPNMETFPTVADFFERKVAIHPFQAHMYNRRDVYAKAGFQHFYHINSEDRLTYTQRSGNSSYINDESAYNEVLKQLRENAGGQFIQLMTMQNHMPYTADQYPDEPELTASGAGFSPNSLQMIETYAKGLRITDRATRDFIEAIRQMDRKITVVFYGDHQPGNVYFGPNFDRAFDSEFANLKRQTNYFIYSNFATNQVEKPVVAPLDFTPMMLEKTNSKVTPFMALMTRVSQELPAFQLGRMMNENGEFADESTLTKEQKELLHLYRLVQYDVTTGQNYLSDFGFYRDEKV